MAYGAWNKQVGQLCWNDILNEKINVYGKDIFCDAIKNVIECGKCNVELPKECSEQNNKKNNKIILGLCISIGLLLFVLILLIIFFREKIKTILTKNNNIQYAQLNY